MPAGGLALGLSPPFSRLADTGSIVNVAWTSDGTHLAGAGGNGTVCFGQLLDRRIQWNYLEVIVDGADTIKTVDIGCVRTAAENQRTCRPQPFQSQQHADATTGVLCRSEMEENLELRDRITNVSVGHGYLVVATLNQMCVYQRNGNEWATPHVFDVSPLCLRRFKVVSSGPSPIRSTPLRSQVKDTPTLLVQCEQYFLTVDSSSVMIYNYEGRMISTPKFSGLRTEFLVRRRRRRTRTRTPWPVPG